jgi:ketosteroid isomerase-like protein
MAGSVAEERVRVLEANRRFYEALTQMNEPAMHDVWLHEEWVRCVHPGWPQVEGWDAVRQSFAQIFENTGSLRITVSRTSVHVEQDMAWVSCIEKISSSNPEAIDTVYAQATNLFVLRDGHWRMVQHHASHLPVETHLQEPERVN